MGTSNICHKRSINIGWDNGYGHDWKFIEKLIIYSEGHFEKIKGSNYIVCHIPRKLDI
jgi:hypothetical protein